MNYIVAKHDLLEQAIDRDEPQLLHEFFERQVDLQPEQVALECNDEVLTYAELDRLANGFAAELRSQGVRAGSLVALYLKKSSRLFAALLGVLKAGAGYVPLDPKFPLGRIQNILEDGAITIVLSEGEMGRALEAQTSARVILVDEDRSENTKRAEPIIVTPSDICYVIYTSGSTGRPKGVVIEHRNAVNFVRALQTIYRLDARDRVYQGFSIAFDASVEEIWAAFALGGTLVVPNEEIARSTLDAAEFINSRQISFFSTVPSFLALMQSDLPTVKLLIVGGEACAPELVTRWFRPGRRMLNTYGPTEATVVATWAECIAGKLVTIGQALPGYSTLVLDEQLRPVQPGECGELYIGGESVARGYMNRPDLTAERFVENPGHNWHSPGGRFYRTYDLVRLTDNGDLQFIGRADGQIKIRGFRVELSEIEAVLMEHPSIQVAAVNVVEFDGLKELAAFVVLQPDIEKTDHGGISALLGSRVPEYMVPKYLDTTESLPTLTSGKVDRKLLPSPCTLFNGSSGNFVVAETDLERALVQIWEKVFQITPISVEADFFLNLRGHSLSAGKVVTEIRVTLDTLSVAVRDLYEYRTIRALALHLQNAGVASVASQEECSDSSAQTNSDTVSTERRWLCAVLQATALIVFYGITSAPAVLAIVLVLKFIDGSLAAGEVAQIATVAGFATWPCWLLLSIAIKWVVIGRYRPGRYPVWGLYYFRWWLVNRFQALSWSEMLAGTPLMSVYYRAMGASVGRNCTINTAHCTAFDLVAIGDDTSIGVDTQLLGYRVENGWLILGSVTLERDCFVGSHCALGLDVILQDGARLGDMSHLADNSVIARRQSMCGAPARAANVELPDAEPRKKSAILFGLFHLALLYVMGWILMLAALPAFALVAYALYAGGPAWAIGAAFLSIPISMLWYLAIVVVTKRLAIGRMAPGLYPVHSSTYLRYWFLNFLLNNTRSLLLPLYATLFFPQILRWLGAKVGRGVEISTIMHVIPELVEIGEGSFLADACTVGAHRIHRGVLEVRGIRIGRRTFIGNSALVPGGAEIGDNCLIGVMSTPPPNVPRIPDESRWLGSPSFELPHTQRVSCFSAQQTFEPTYGLVCLRASIDILRIVLPGVAFVAALILFVTAITHAYYTLPLVAVFLLASAIALIISLMSVAVVAWVKNLLIGRYDPTVQPLWCTYVWFNEVINALYETIAAPAMTPLMGTPFIAPCLRLMGCRIGRWVFLQTTLFSEFDLVEIGDDASVNFGCTLQTHLFEDRVMKSGRLRIGNGCSVGNMAVVLYGTEMKKGSCLEPLSVLMKGEVLPCRSRWSGIPTQPVRAGSSSANGPAENAQKNVPQDPKGYAQLGTRFRKMVIKPKLGT